MGNQPMGMDLSHTGWDLSRMGRDLSYMGWDLSRVGRDLNQVEVEAMPAQFQPIPKPPFPATAPTPRTKLNQRMMDRKRETVFGCKALETDAKRNHAKSGRETRNPPKIRQSFMCILQT